MLTKEEKLGLKKMRGLMLLSRMDDIIKLKNMGMSDKDISRFVGCLERGIKLFTINFLSEKDGIYYKKEYGLPHVLARLDNIVETLKEKEFNKQEAYDILVSSLQSIYGRTHMKRKNIKKGLWNQVKEKMTDDDFKKLLELNEERLSLNVLLNTSIGDESIEICKKIKKIKTHRVWVKHQVILNEIYALYSEYDQIKLNGHQWTI